MIRLPGRQQPYRRLPLRHVPIRHESPAKVNAAWCGTSIGFPCQTVPHSRGKVIYEMTERDGLAAKVVRKSLDHKDVVLVTRMF
jgi:hypothetical protein